jgi:hypothetical protein
LFDALNSTAIIVHEDGPDEDGYVYAWDETSHANAALIVEAVNALPSLIDTIRTQQARIDALETESSRLRIGWWNDMQQRGYGQDFAIAKIDAALLEGATK